MDSLASSSNAPSRRPPVENMLLSLPAEAWLWYGIAMAIIALRYIARYLQLGSIKKFHTEDYAMIFVAIFFTAFIATLTKVAVIETNLIPPDVPAINPESIPERIYGSKLTFAVEVFWCATVWGCKACLLFLYATLTVASRQRFLVYIVSGYVGANYVLMMILLFGAWCRPFHNYWSVPAANDQCSTYHKHLIVTAVFNISSDLMMLCIPLPILIRLHLPLKKKIVLVAVFSLGIFVILSACLSKYYSFSLPFGQDWTFWYVREVGTAVIVANIPHCWVLIRRIFNVRSFLSNHNTGTRTGIQSKPGRGAGSANGFGGPDTTISKSSYSNYGMQTDIESTRGPKSHGQWFKMKLMAAKSTTTDTSLSRSSSEEHIILQSSSGANKNYISRSNSVRQSSISQPLEIYQDIQYSVHREESPRTLTDNNNVPSNQVPDHWDQQPRNIAGLRAPSATARTEQRPRTPSLGAVAGGATLLAATAAPQNGSSGRSSPTLGRYDIPSLNGDDWRTRTIVTARTETNYSNEQQ